MAKDVIDLEIMLDDLLTLEEQQSNCMFQLSLMLARIALEPGPESYKEDMAQALLGLIRSKPKKNVVPLFGVARFGDGQGSKIRATA